MKFPLPSLSPLLLPEFADFFFQHGMDLLQGERPVVDPYFFQLTASNGIKIVKEGPEFFFIFFDKISSYFEKI